jgi:hypothetical protein
MNGIKLQIVQALPPVTVDDAGIRVLFEGKVWFVNPAGSWERVGGESGGGAPILLARVRVSGDEFDPDVLDVQVTEIAVNTDAAYTIQKGANDNPLETFRVIDIIGNGSHVWYFANAQAQTFNSAVFEARISPDGTSFFVETSKVTPAGDDVMIYAFAIPAP